MDLWDVATVMWRRRGVTVPLLLLSAIAAVFALLTIPPGYSTKAQIAFLAPPAAQPGQAANPFTVGGLAEFLSITLNRQEIRQQVGQGGLLADYRVTFKSDGLPLIGLEVVGRERDEVVKTVDRLILLVETEAAKLQTNVAPGGVIAVSVADRGDDIRVVRSAGRRSLVVIAGVGLFATAGVALAVDALIRRRSRGPEPPQRRLVPRQSVPAHQPAKRPSPVPPAAAAAVEPEVETTTAKAAMGAAAVSGGSRLVSTAAVREALGRATPGSGPSWRSVSGNGAAETSDSEEVGRVALDTDDDADAAGELETAVREAVKLREAVTVSLDHDSAESMGDNDVTVVLPLAGVARSNGKQGKSPLGKRLNDGAAPGGAKKR